MKSPFPAKKWPFPPFSSEAASLSFRAKRGRKFDLYARPTVNHNQCGFFFLSFFSFSTIKKKTTFSRILEKRPLTSASISTGLTPPPLLFPFRVISIDVSRKADSRWEHLTWKTWHYTLVQNRRKHRKNGYPIIHFPTSKQCKQASKRVSPAERKSSVRGRANKRAGGPVLQSGFLVFLAYSALHYWVP